MTASELLRAAKALIADPAKWWNGGWPERPDCLCAVQAINSIGGGLLGETGEKARQLFRSAVGTGVADFNDTHSHVEVMAAFDRAIELAEASVYEWTSDTR